MLLAVMPVQGWLIVGLYETDLAVMEVPQGTSTLAFEDTEQVEAVILVPPDRVTPVLVASSAMMQADTPAPISA